MPPAFLQSRPDRRARRLLPLIVLTGLVLPAFVAVMPREGRPVVVFAWSAEAGGAAAIAARASGELRATNRGNRIAIASSEASGFVARLYGAGAALVLDATLAVACLSPFLALAKDPAR